MLEDNSGLEESNVNNDVKASKEVLQGYPQTVKDEALKLYHEGILSKRAIAKRLDVSYQTINNWIKIAEESQQGNEDVGEAVSPAA